MAGERGGEDERPGGDFPLQRRALPVAGEGLAHAGFPRQDDGRLLRRAMDVQRRRLLEAQGVDVDRGRGGQVQGVRDVRLLGVVPDETCHQRRKVRGANARTVLRWTRPGPGGAPAEEDHETQTRPCQQKRPALPEGRASAPGSWCIASSHFPFLLIRSPGVKERRLGTGPVA